VDVADSQAACEATCSAPTVNSVAPDAIGENEEVALTVLTSALPAVGYSYRLSVTGPESAQFACESPSGDSCTATVSGLAAGTYSASLSIQALSGSMPSFSTASVPSALTVTQVIAPPVSCFEGGTGQDPDGSGTCASPYAIDLIGNELGTILSHAPGGWHNESFGSGGSNCDWAGLQHTEVYRVNLPDGAGGFEVSVDAAGTANPRIVLLEDTSCSQPANLCVDDGAADACEVMRATAGTGQYFGDSPYVVVTLNDDVAQMVVRFRAF
jgi:hypothetical protein